MCQIQKVRSEKCVGFKKIVPKNVDLAHSGLNFANGII